MEEGLQCVEKWGQHTENSLSRNLGKWLGWHGTVKPLQNGENFVYLTAS